MHDELFSFKTFTNFAIFFKYCATNLSYIRSCFTCIADMTSRFQTTAAVFYLTSSGRPARSSLYRRQAGVSSFWCHRLERPASHVTSAPSLSVFGQRLELSVFPFLPGHYHDSCVTITIHQYCLDTCDPCNTSLFRPR